MNLPDILSQGEDHIYKEVPKTTTGRMAHIAVMRKTDSYNIFTTEGSELNMAETEKTTSDSEKVQRVVMFKRKQVASERRTGKAELRGLYENHKEDIDTSEAFGDFEGGDELCRLHDNLGGECIDCKLYGFANAKGKGNDGVSRSSRVLTDSTFAIRDIKRRKDITFNAQSEAAEAESSTALNSRAHTKPETYFPSIITLKDFTYRELYWLVYMIENTTRYGAETSRTGYVDNKVVSVWFDTSETMSNLELTQRTAETLGNLEDLDSSEVEEAIENSVPESDVDVDALREAVEDATDSDKDKIEFLQELHRSQTGDLSE